MTATAEHGPALRYAPARAPRPTAVVRALAGTELRRRFPYYLVTVGLAVSLWYLLSITPGSEDWTGASYSAMATTSAPLLLTVSLVTAASFHRERSRVAPAAPVGAAVRIAGRLVAAVPLVGVTGVLALVVGWRQRQLGGMPLGTEPGRTAEALQTSGELAQHVALGLLAVALGAAVGRRAARLVAAVPVLFLVWFVAAGVYWLFGHPAVTPFSVVQVQPVTLPVGPASTDPLSFPEHWLLSPPSEHQEGWGRVFVSSALAWWHCVWLAGLSALLLATVAPPGAARRGLLAAGLTVAVAGAVAQLQVIP